MSRSLRVFLAGLVSVFLLSVLGCHQATLFAGAAVRQNPLCQVGPSGGWTFNGLDARVPPRIRPGSYPSATHGVRFLGPADLGPHGYRFNWPEQSGIMYACRAGHIDIAHARKGADWTGYLAAVVLEHLEKGRTSFQFRQMEPSVYRVDLTLPDYWKDLGCREQERIAREVARDLGQYLAWTGLTWHEILTWFGYRFKMYQSEFPSAFSWEDSYSNLLGSHIGAAALRDESRPFSEAATRSLDEWLEELGAQPAHVARQAAEAMKGQWFSAGWFSTAIHERNLDIGVDDGYVTPRLVPALADCGAAQPRPLAVPTLDSLARYGFSMKLEIEPRVWEAGRILRIVCPDGRARRIEPAIHFPLLMDHIERDAIARGISLGDSEALGR